MFWKDDRWKRWVFSSPPIEIGGYNACPDSSGMLDVFRAEILAVYMMVSERVYDGIRKSTTRTPKEYESVSE